MWKVLIIDDEPILREGLKTIIDWEGLGFRVCGEASHGQEGYERIKMLKPELVVVDMKMPVMNGLELIEKLKREGKNAVKIIILTGYSYFEYAKKAVEYGVEGYLLKPVDEDELEELVKKTGQKLQEEARVRETLTRGVMFSREQFLRRLIVGEQKDIGVQEVNNLYDFDFPWETYQIVLVDLEDELTDTWEIKDRVIHQIKDFSNRTQLGFVFEFEDKIGILCRGNKENENLNLMIEIRSAVKDAAGADIVLAAGKPVNELSKLSTSFESAMALLKKKFLYGSQKVLTEELVQGVMSPQVRLDMEQIVDALVIGIKNNLEDKITQILEQVYEYHQSNHTFPEGIKAYYASMYVSMVNKLMEDDENYKDILQNDEETLSEIYKQTSLMRLSDLMQHKMMYITSRISDMKPVDIMDQAVEYIQKNYEKDLKLENLARIFNYNSAYFGKLFRKHTGKYFNSYLDSVRIEKAKQLLETGMKVYEAAERVGYSNIDYFYRKFRKYTGRAPSEYKKG